MRVDTCETHFASSSLPKTIGECVQEVEINAVEFVRREQIEAPETAL